MGKTSPFCHFQPLLAAFVGGQEDPKESDGRGVADGDVGGKVAVTAEAG